MELTIVSQRHAPDKAAEVLLTKAKAAGFKSIGEVMYELLPPSINPHTGTPIEYVHRFTAVAV